MRLIILFLLMSLMTQAQIQPKNVTDYSSIPLDIVRCDSTTVGTVRSGKPLYFGNSYKAKSYISFLQVKSLNLAPLDASKFYVVAIRVVSIVESTPLVFVASSQYKVIESRPKDWFSIIEYELNDNAKLTVTTSGRGKDKNQIIDIRIPIKRRKDLVMRYYVDQMDDFDFPGTE